MSRTPSPPTLSEKSLYPRRAKRTIVSLAALALPEDLQLKSNTSSNGESSMLSLDEEPRKLSPLLGLLPPPGLLALPHEQPARVEPESNLLLSAVALKQHSLTPAVECTAALLAPQPIPASEQSTASEELAWLSVGSVGHPHSCAEGCRYIKRKGGCRDGANCPSCHLCFWRRAEEKPSADENVMPERSGAFISIGTRGHPHTCSAPCRYVRRKEGCRDGASCQNCHACLWQRERNPEPIERAEPEKPSEPQCPSSIFGESGKTLRELIVVLLSEQSGEGIDA